MFPRQKITLASLVAFILSITGTHPVVVYAQSQDSELALEEVVVTARRRAESLQDTPLSVSAYSSAQLETRGVTIVTDVGKYTPNVQFDPVATESGGGASSQVYIRGIGQTDYVITVEPGVGVYLDGVYVGKSMGSLLDAVDIE